PARRDDAPAPRDEDAAEQVARDEARRPPVEAPGQRHLAETLGDEALERVVVEGDPDPAGRLRLGLQAGLADDRAEDLRRIERACREEPGEDGQGSDAGRPSPDALDARQPALHREDLVVLGVAGDALALAEEPQHPRALLARIAGRQALRHRVADLERRDGRTLAKRARDGVSPRRLS